MFLPFALIALGTWELVEERDGVTIERRVVSDSRYLEVRVSTRCALKPERVAESVWQIRDEGVEASMLKLRKMIIDGPSERLMYEQVKTPIVNDRDFTVRLKRVVDPQTGVHQILFHADNAAGPPETGDHVRIRALHGSWTFEPDGEGSIVTYACFSDPAGSVPPWLVRGQQLETAFDLIREALRYAGARPSLAR